MRELIDELLQRALQTPKQLKLQVELELDLEACFVDSTCVKADLHFPTDWILLRAGVRTLMKAVRLIRREGLKGRMESPEEFMKRLNTLCMEMAQEVSSSTVICRLGGLSKHQTVSLYPSRAQFPPIAKRARCIYVKQVQVFATTRHLSGSTGGLHD